jgi:hypothetical protein
VRRSLFSGYKLKDTRPTTKEANPFLWTRETSMLRDTAKMARENGTQVESFSIDGSAIGRSR